MQQRTTSSPVHSLATYKEDDAPGGVPGRPERAALDTRIELSTILLKHRCKLAWQM